jgi:adenylate kinase family enzyme
LGLCPDIATRPSFFRGFSPQQGSGQGELKSGAPPAAPPRNAVDSRTPRAHNGRKAACGSASKMRVADRIHILGASGSGVSTLGAELASRFGYAHLDVDRFFWEPTDPPFTTMREVGERRRMLAAALDAHPRWVLSGSMCGWGNVFVPRFELVVFLYLPPAIRMARLRERERMRYGEAAIRPGGPMHQRCRAFIEWAASYDSGDETIRSLALHQRWLAALACPTIRLEGPLALDEQIAGLRGRAGPA